LKKRKFKEKEEAREKRKKGREKKICRVNSPTLLFIY